MDSVPSQRRQVRCLFAFPVFKLPNIPTVQKGQNNLAFAILLQLNDVHDCVDLLIKTKRAPEAALFARTHGPR